MPLLTAEQFTALRDSLVGEYEPSGCVPSADCCCAVGRTKVTANETSPMLMNVDTKLKGEGFSCLQKDGQRGHSTQSECTGRLPSAGTYQLAARGSPQISFFNSVFIYSCRSNISGDIHMTFTLLNATAAEAQPFGAVNVKFMAEMHNDTVRN